MKKYYNETCKYCGKTPIMHGRKDAMGKGKSKTIKKCCTCGREQ